MAILRPSGDRFRLGSGDLLRILGDILLSSGDIRLRFGDLRLSSGDLLTSGDRLLPSGDIRRLSAERRLLESGDAILASGDLLRISGDMSSLGDRPRLRDGAVPIVPLFLPSGERRRIGDILRPSGDLLLGLPVPDNLRLINKNDKNRMISIKIEVVITD